MGDSRERTVKPAFERFPENPVITPDMDARMGQNVNGPSLIRVPDWLEGPLGRYYLYFAHHQGSYIRLAYADDLAGPWRGWHFAEGTDLPLLLRGGGARDRRRRRRYSHRGGGEVGYR